MKIPGSEGNENKLKRLQDGVSGDKSSNGIGVKAGQNRTESGMPAAPGLSADDSVKVSSLGTLLKSELDPSRMAEERRQKVEFLKQQIRDGTYTPPLEGIAQAMAEELSFEILLGGEENKDDDTIL